MEFWRIYRLVYAKRWLIAAIMLIASAVIFIGATLQAQKKLYQADAMIKPLERAVSQNVGASGGGRDSGGVRDSGVPITDLIMLPRTSYDLHREAARLLKLGEDERASKVQRILEENGIFGQRDALVRKEALRVASERGLGEAATEELVRKSITESRKLYAENLAKARDARGAWGAAGLNWPEDDIATDMQGRVKFGPVSGPLATEKEPDIANLIRVQAYHEREAAAELYANLACVAFIDFYTAQSRNQIQVQRNVLEQQRDLARGQWQKARKELVAYQRRGDVVPLNPKQSAAVSNVVKYEDARNLLQAEIEAAKATINTTRELLRQQAIVKTKPLPSTEDPLVRSREAALSEAEVVFRTVSANKLENHPDYNDAKARLDAARRELERVRSIPFTVSAPNAAVENYEAQLGAAQVRLNDAQAKLAAVGQQLAAERAKVARLPAAQAQLAELEREVTLYEDNLNQIDKALTGFNINSVNQDTAGTITITSQANGKRVGGDGDTRWQLMAYGAVLALIFGIALVVAMDALDNSVRSTEDAEKLLGLPVAGVIPAQLPDPNRAPRITYLDPLSPAAEAYRLLRTDLLFTAEEHPFKSLMLLTGKPGQGATTTACNLAIAMAQAGKRVILVDADLRRPKLHDVFKVKNDIGLTTLLNDECEIEEALKATEIDNLLLLPSGPLPLNPSELLASPKMKALHEQLKPHTLHPVRHAVCHRLLGRGGAVLVPGRGADGYARQRRPARLRTAGQGDAEQGKGEHHRRRPERHGSGAGGFGPLPLSLLPGRYPAGCAERRQRQRQRPPQRGGRYAGAAGRRGPAGAVGCGGRVRGGRRGRRGRAAARLRRKNAELRVPGAEPGRGAGVVRPGEQEEPLAAFQGGGPLPADRRDDRSAGAGAEQLGQLGRPGRHDEAVKRTVRRLRDGSGKGEKALPVFFCLRLPSGDN